MNCKKCGKELIYPYIETEGEKYCAECGYTIVPEYLGIKMKPLFDYDDDSKVTEKCIWLYTDIWDEDGYYYASCDYYHYNYMGDMKNYTPSTCPNCGKSIKYIKQSDEQELYNELMDDEVENASL